MTEPPELAARELDEAEVEAIVDRALRGRISLEALVERALFGKELRIRGREAEILWGQWPVHARDTWDLAVKRYRERARLSGTQRRPNADVSPEAMWSTMESLANGSWPAIPNVKPAQIARALNISPRSVPYWTRKLGWVLGGRRSTRRIIVAPCARCGKTTPAAQIRKRRCRTCIDQRDPERQS